MYIFSDSIKQQINVDTNTCKDTLFAVRGGLTVNGRYEEYIRVSNQINLDKLSINMSTCLPSDIRVAKAIAQLYVDTMAAAEERLQQNKGV